MNAMSYVPLGLAISVNAGVEVNVARQYARHLACVGSGGPPGRMDVRGRKYSYS